MPPFSFPADYNNMSKFLNRILGMEVEMQNHLFAYFTSTLEAIIQQARRDGKYDMGILGECSRTANVPDNFLNFAFFFYRPIKSFSNANLPLKLEGIPAQSHSHC